MQESFLEELELVQEDLLANDLVIEGEYMTEECMKTEWKFSQYLGGQLHYCKCCTIGYSMTMVFQLPRQRIDAIKKAAMENPKKLMRPTTEDSMDM